MYKPSNGPEITPIPWDKVVVISDLDNTLVGTPQASALAVESIRRTFEPLCGAEKAVGVRDGFSGLFELMRTGHNARSNDPETLAAYESLISDVDGCQEQVQATYGSTKRWSREVMIKLAADRAGVSTDPDVVHAAADAYWTTLAKNTEVFPDAKEFAGEVHAHGRPFVIATSSDGRLMMRPDGQFTYDPAYSEAKKRERIELLKEKGLRFSGVSIGDPEDKPGVGFFLKAIHMAEDILDHEIDLRYVVMLGDSYKADLQTPKDELGVGLVVLREVGRQREAEVVDGRQINVRSLDELLGLNILL